MSGLSQTILDVTSLQCASLSQSVARVVLRITTFSMLDMLDAPRVRLAITTKEINRLVNTFSVLLL